MGEPERRTIKPEDRDRIRSQAQREREERRAAFGRYIVPLLADRGVTLRAASMAMGRDESFLSQFTSEKSRARDIPSPDDLKRLAEWLDDISLLPRLLEVAWGIDIGQAREQVQAMLAQRTAEVEDAGIRELSERDKQIVLALIAHLRASGVARREATHNGGD